MQHLVFGREKQALHHGSLGRTKPYPLHMTHHNPKLTSPAPSNPQFRAQPPQAAHRGNLASRISHSCTPNCTNLSLAVGGRLTNAMFSTRPVAQGEELCWDYACVTESEKEFRAAVCMCCSARCRGSFLYYANSSSFQWVRGASRH